MTLRELQWAAKGKRQTDWDHTAALLAVHAKNVDPRSLNPYRRRSTGGEPLTAETLHDWADRLKAQKGCSKLATK